MSNSIRCTWWEYTGEMTEFVNGISSPKLRSLETGEVRSQKDLPAGALFAVPREGQDGTQLDKDLWPPAGHDGLSVVCLVPGSGGLNYWYIDSRASNCTRRDSPGHRCWVRHGTVGGQLHVDKSGDTCSAGAGAGSIAMPGYHGFLHNGHLTEC